MWVRLLLAGVLLAGIEAFGLAPIPVLQNPVVKAAAPAPIRWGEVLGNKFLGTVLGFHDKARPAKLTILDQPGKKIPNEVPYFTAKADKTIAWDATGLCIEASGDKNGDAVQVNHCTGRSNQLWNLLPRGHTWNNQIQLQGTNMCINVNERGVFYEATVELHQCDDKVTESWKFDGNVEASWKSEVSPIGRNHWAHWFSTFSSMVALSTSAFGVLSLNARLWRWHTSARTVARSQNGTCLNMEQGGGVCLRDPSAVPAMMALSLEEVQDENLKGDALPEGSVNNRDTYPEDPDKAYRVLNVDFVPRLGWQRTVFPAVVSPVLASVAASGGAFVLHDMFGFSGIDAIAHTVLGVLVSFLTVFRTQQAYGRYWESRGHLGVLMAGIVDVASTASVQLPGTSIPEAKEELARLLRLYMHESVKFFKNASLNTQRVSQYWLPEDADSKDGTALGDDQCYCNATPEECEIASTAQTSVINATPEECEVLATAARPPVIVLQWVRAHLIRCFAARSADDVMGGVQAYQLGVDRVISQLQASWNGCAKIATTPMPQPFTQMSRWLVFFFVYTVPLAFLKSFADYPIVVVLATALLTFGYYGLDYCANQLQNPFVADFGDVALDGRFLRIVCEDVDLLLLSPTKADSPELYAIIHRGADVTEGESIDSKVVDHLIEGTLVAVQAKVSQGDRVRANIQHPHGWITLHDTSSGSVWAEKVESTPAAPAAV